VTRQNRDRQETRYTILQFLAHTHRRKMELWRLGYHTQLGYTQAYVKHCRDMYEQGLLDIELTERGGKIAAITDKGMRYYNLVKEQLGMLSIV
jgi:predicted transcriptional regulator